MTARTIQTAILGLSLVLAAASTADARPRPGGRISGKQFEANKTFGLGLELGTPVGLTGKYFISGDRAIDFGVGDSYSYFGRSGLNVYGDYLFHPVSLASTEDFELPLYIGLGARFWDFAATGTSNAVAIGFRVPVGISFDFNNVPIDTFIQLAPVLDFFANYDPHTVYLDFDFTVGIRYWFN
jgi:hypothetical protein